MKLHLASILTVLFALTFPHQAGAYGGTFYLHTSSVLLPLAGGQTGTHVLTLDAPTIDDKRWVGATINPGHMVMLRKFVSLPTPGPAQVDPGPATATLHLVTTGQPITGKAMFGCAEIRIDLYHESPGHRVLIADDTFFDRTIPPDHQIGDPRPPDPLSFPLAIDASRGALAPGDGISVEVRVRNRCNEVRRVLLLYDAVNQPSRLQLAENCLPNPDQPDNNGDGIADVCQGVGGPDSDGDGVGEKWDACPGTPPSQVVDRTGCACSQLTCDDGDPCTSDTCVPSSGCQHATDCACPLLTCDDGDACTSDTCVPGPGCQHAPPLGIDALGCQLEEIRDSITTAAPGAVAARLTNPRSTLMRALKRSIRLVRRLQAEPLRSRGSPRRDRTLRRLQHAFARLVALIEIDSRMNLIVPELHTRLAGIIDQVVLVFADVGPP